MTKTVTLSAFQSPNDTDYCPQYLTILLMTKITAISSIYNKANDKDCWP